MRKPNLALKFLAAAVTVQKKSAKVRSPQLKAYYTRKAARCLNLASRAKDSEKAVATIAASNTYAQASPCSEGC